MKTINQLLVLGVFMLSFTLIYGQNKTDCTVVGGEVDAIYVGKCKDGLASGQGMLEYENSLGKYMYVGDFKKGKMHGNGKLYSFVNDEKQLLKEGIWKNSVYKGEKNVVYKPYEIKRRENVDRYSIKKVADGNKVLFSFRQNGNTNYITNLKIEGDSGARHGQAFDEKSDNQGFENIEFPFKCLVTYTTSNKLRTSEYDVRFEVVINESGSWDIALNN